ncbi:TonB-dependent receptor domain-containing protein [Methylotenera sp. N17]|uniref:TonB-dependent receptor domain-containing protein n=1 Tax=Methylotenera sp. N17 TaxID=1502761 RepID=UPI0006473933|nr:TonB-dependent receptor [Methylotenera sp. N17]
MKYSKRQQLKSLALAVSVSGSAFMSGLLLPTSVQSEELNTKLPATQDNHFNLPVTVDLPKQPLSMSLKEFARSSGLSLSFDNKLVDGKTAPAIKGRMTRKEVLRELLSNSGLTTELDGDSAVLKKIPDTDSTNIQLDQINVRAKRFYEVGPLPGLGLTKDQIPGNVQSITAKEIKESHSLSLTDLMNKKLQSVNVNDYQGNPFQMDVTYRGFTAGPQIGTPQGLSVFFDGIRVNEPFGDVVNWDMIPMNALASVDVFPGSNPIFGLNTLGGAFTLKTKDGFNNTGVDAEVLTGSFGRKQLQVEGGVNNGTFALFGAGNFFLEDGWRENSPSKVNQLFTKASYRGDKLDINLSTLWVGTDLVGNGLLPSQMYQQDRNASFTSEDTTKNRLSQFQLSGSYFVNDNFTITGQTYRRDSKRRSLGADAYTDGFGDTNYVLRNLDPGEEFTCQYLSTNQYRIPDYYVLDIDPLTGSNAFLDDFNANSGDPAYDLYQRISDFAGVITKNGELTAAYAQAAEYNFNYYKNDADTRISRPNDPVPINLGPIETYSNGDFSYQTLDQTLWNFPKSYALDIDPNIEGNFNYFYTTDGVKHIVATIAPINKSACYNNPQLLVAPTSPTGTSADRFRPDGNGFADPGLVEGTPVALLTDNNIKQIVDGGSFQFNWNLEKHKFMVGASIDVASASYTNSQRLGLFDNNRKAYLSPEGIRDQYTAADVPISNNDFDGTSVTKSIYASETWSPIDTLHITGAIRYNDTHVKNKVATRTAFTFFDLANYQSRPDDFGLCFGSAANCPSSGYRQSDGSKVLKPAETEKFSYYSLNPSFGASWQAKENLNVYGNFAQGTRTPSVIELGCAFDRTPIYRGGAAGDPNDPANYVAKSLQENRSCSLPTTLSGDPFLPQIKATTYDIGLRGSFKGLLETDNLQWNLGAYRTNLKDDIYLVGIGGTNSFFDTVGKTKRQGIEAGLSGNLGKWGFGLNYALTDATFQDTFDIISPNNSSAVQLPLFSTGREAFKSITVKPGDRMPGVPLHNLNASMNYEVTPKWQVGLSAVLHSESFIRGNENNKHKQGVAETYVISVPDGVGGFVPVTATRQPFTNPGKVAGYTVFNLQTSYKFNNEWIATMQISNLFDKEYFSAGRLGRNPFSPSINGAIGPGGYNHNSDDWLASNFLAPGAPRGIWFSLRYSFDPNAKPSF